MYLETAAALLNADSCLNQWQRQWGIFIAYLFFLKVPDTAEPSACLCIVVDRVWRTSCHKPILSSSSLATRCSLVISRWALGCNIYRKYVQSFLLLEVNEQYSRFLAPAHQAAWNQLKNTEQYLHCLPPSLNAAFPLHWSNQTAVTFQSLPEWQN